MLKWWAGYLHSPSLQFAYLHASNVEEALLRRFRWEEHAIVLEGLGFWKSKLAKPHLVHNTETRCPH